MSIFLTHIIARDSDAESWMEILVLVVMAVLWAIGGILKARGTKTKQQKAGQPTFRIKIRRGPVERIYGPRGQPKRQFQPTRKKVMRPRPTIQEPFVQAPTIQPSMVPQLSPLIPEVEPRLERLPRLEATIGIGEGLKKEKLGIPADQAVPSMEPLQTLLDFDEPDNLTKAILHYEILGRPLSLRDPSEHIIEL
jgi:hypothetical protein